MPPFEQTSSGVTASDSGEHAQLLSAADMEASLVAGEAGEADGLRHHDHDHHDGLAGGSADSGDSDDHVDLEGDSEDRRQRTRSVWYMMLLTLSIGGLQIAWSVELSNGSPFLLSLGLSKSLMALVWIAGPLTGTLVQPYVGMLSDRCRLSWGKRKPFMLGGAAATMVSLMCLAWTRETVAGTLQAVFGADPTSGGVRTAVIVVAVFWVYVLDFAINTGKGPFHLVGKGGGVSLLLFLSCRSFFFWFFPLFPPFSASFSISSPSSYFSPPLSLPLSLLSLLSSSPTC